MPCKEKLYRMRESKLTLTLQEDSAGGEHGLVKAGVGSPGSLD